MNSPIPSRYEGFPDMAWSPTQESIRAATKALFSCALATHRHIAGEYERSLLHAPPVSSSDMRVAGVNTRSRRSEEHTSELQSLMRNSYAVFCLKTKKHK